MNAGIKQAYKFIIGTMFFLAFLSIGLPLILISFIL